MSRGAHADELALAQKAAAGNSAAVREIEQLIAIEAAGAINAVTKYYEYGNFHPTVREDAASGQFDGAVVLVAKNGDAGSALMLNDPFTFTHWP